MTVTVAMPYYGCPDLVERAVRSVLAQTHQDLRLVVIGDGEKPPLANVTDSRLVVYNLPENRGTYYAFQLILQASPDEWHAPHGADDWTDPEHVEILLAFNHPAVAMGNVWIHADGNVPFVGKLGREGWHVGIFSSERLKAIGGYDPTARLSQDTHVLKLLDLTGGYLRFHTANPTYHIWQHGASLTAAPLTGLRSTARRVARAYNRKIILKAWRMRDAARIRQLRESLIPLEVQDELAGHIEKLRDQLA